ncbi:MAG: multidrug ABC transporter ATP-binding protein, partial [Asticcacaulis sp.]|nr:multidrug ABC transporter ATP-binding protein [Asticcacaulis sp.]
MLNALYSRFERLVDPFRSYKEQTPPVGLYAFFWMFLGQVWPVFVAILVAGFLDTVTEVTVFRYIADLVYILTHT